MFLGTSLSCSHAMPEGSLVHDGFQDTQGRTADLVLSTVKSSLSATGFKRVLTTGEPPSENSCRSSRSRDTP